MAILKLELQELAATERFGQFLSVGLVAGDVIALQGPLGAGKSALARALISKLCPGPLVPICRAVCTDLRRV